MAAVVAQSVRAITVWRSNPGRDKPNSLKQVVKVHCQTLGNTGHSRCGTQRNLHYEMAMSSKYMSIFASFTCRGFHMSEIFGVG